MIHLVTALDKVLHYARRLQSTWPKNIFGRLKLLYPKHLELLYPKHLKLLYPKHLKLFYPKHLEFHFEMQKCKTVNDSPSWDLKKCLFSVGQWLVSATIEGYGVDPSAITWLLDLSWWFPQRLECACACTKLPMPGKLSSYTGSRFLTLQLGSGGRENPPPLLGWHSFKITSTGTIYPKLKEHDSQKLSQVDWSILSVWQKSLTTSFGSVLDEQATLQQSIPLRSETSYFPKNWKYCGSETPDFEPVCQPQVPCFDIVHALLSRLPHRERTFCTRPSLIFTCN